MSNDNSTKINVSNDGGDKGRDFSYSSDTGKVYETTSPWLGRNHPTEVGSAPSVAGAIDVAKSVSGKPDGKIHLS